MKVEAPGLTAPRKDRVGGFEVEGGGGCEGQNSTCVCVHGVVLSSISSPSLSSRTKLCELATDTVLIDFCVPGEDGAFDCGETGASRDLVSRD